MDRIFAVVTITDVIDKVNAIGAGVIDQARKSLDGTQIILDFNHHRLTIDGLFLDGVDVDSVIAGCQMLNHQQASDLMESDGWLNEGDI